MSSDTPKLDEAQLTPLVQALALGDLLAPAPPRTLGVLQTSYERRKDLRWFLEGMAKAVRGEDPHSFPQARRKELDDLATENARLKAELDCERTMRSQAENLLKTERLNPASRAGIYRTLFASLVSGLGLRPDNESALASIPAQLVEDLATVGGSLDIKTARKHVREAVKQFKYDQLKR